MLTKHFFSHPNYLTTSQKMGLDGLQKRLFGLLLFFCFFDKIYFKRLFCSSKQAMLLDIPSLPALHTLLTPPPFPGLQKSKSHKTTFLQSLSPFLFLLFLGSIFLNLKSFFSKFSHGHISSILFSLCSPLKRD